MNSNNSNPATKETFSLMNGTIPRSSLATTADVAVLRTVGSVTTPAPTTTPLRLPGVMDAEGRVDESRLRMHIFKNGK